MRARDYYELFRYLSEQYCLAQDSVVFVENIADWCKENGIDEPDRNTPMKLIPRGQHPCFMLIKEDIPASVIEQRVNAMSIRGQVKNVAFDRADMLDSVRKKLAYLFLSEYAMHLPEIKDDPLLADDLAFDMMDNLGYFQDVKKE